MITRRFNAVVELPARAAEVYEWHARPGAIQRLTPAWAGVQVVKSGEGLRNGSKAVLRMRSGPFHLDWVALHRDCLPGRQFIDEQLSGPFAHWVHAHRFVDTSEGHSRLEDDIEYALPGGALGHALAGSAVEHRLRSLFAWRHALVRADLERHRQSGAGVSWRIAVSGASGLIGGALVPFLRTGGHEVATLVRRSADAARGEVGWDPRSGAWDGRALEGFDAVVHLAGRSIAAGRWTRAAKDEILRSRTESTRQLALSLAALKDPPKTLLCASAIGFYGDREDSPADEQAPAGKGFLAEVSRAWEEACAPAVLRGIRVIHLRFGVVLSAGGGALAKMLPAFRLGLGGRVGDGRQWMSWIALDDVLGAIGFVLGRREISGPVNVVSPQAVRNADFVRVLGRVLGRPAFLPLPAPVVGLLFGAMGRELLLQGQRVLPRTLSEAGFVFRHPFLEEGLRFELGKTAPD